MAAPEKLLQTWDLLADVEVTYGTNPTLDGTNGILTIERAEPTPEYLHDGQRNTSAGGRLRPSAPAGRGEEIVIQVEAFGLDSSSYYSATVKPFIHALLVACGLEATFTDVDTTPGNGDEQWVYAPESSDFDSLSIESYSRGQKYELNGAYGTFTVTVDGPAVPTWEFTYRGIGNVPVDGSPPSITSYPANDNLPTQAVDIGLSINPAAAGAITDMVLRGFTLDLNRDMTARADDNATTPHAGFAPGLPEPTLELVVESRALTSADPYSWWDDGDECVVLFSLGVDNETWWSFKANHAYVTNVEDGDDGPMATWVISFGLRVDSMSDTDFFEIGFGVDASGLT